MELMEKLFMGNEDFVRSVLNSSNSGILVVDREGIIIFINTAGKKILNTSKKKLEGEHFSSINKSGWKAFRKIMDTGEPELGKKFEIDDQAIISSRTPIKRDGKNIGVLSIFQEISAVEKIMPELSSYQNMLKTMDAVFESSYDGLYVTDGEANTLRVNSSWEKITGLSAKDVVGTEVSPFLEVFRTGPRIFFSFKTQITSSWHRF
jgi:PAS domain S-box-containing protein